MRRRSPTVLVIFAVALACAGCGSGDPAASDAGADGSADARAAADGAPLDASLAETAREAGPAADALSVPLEPSQFQRVGAHTLAAIIVNFSDATESITAAQLRQRVFGAANKWFREVSYGKFWFEGARETAGDVFVVTLPNSSKSCDHDAWSSAAQTLAAKDGFVVADYDFVFYFFAGACKSRGRPGTTPPSAWIDNASVRAIAHEGGHAIGWSHASGYRCVAQGARASISSTCTVGEYDDPFDVMGGNGTYQVNQHKRGQMGWLEPANTVTAQADGRYSVAPIERPSSAALVVRVPRIVGPSGVEQFIYVEARRPAGFDDFAPTAPVATGVTLRLAGPYSAGGRSLLIDTRVASAEFQDAPLAVGQTFVDAATKISITAVDVGAQGATLDIKSGTPLRCVPAAPALSFAPATVVAQPGGLAKLTMTLRDADKDCAIAVHLGSYSLPSGWTKGELDSFEATLLPGDERTFNIAVKVPAGAAPGQYSVSATVTNTTSTLGATASATVEVR